MKRDLYPELAWFLGTRYHEDWTLEADTALQIAVLFAADEDPVLVSKVVRELDEVLRSERTDAGLAVLVAELGSRYDPGAEGRSVRAWLEDVRKILAPKSNTTHSSDAGN
jgi:hypothetical protein